MNIAGPIQNSSLRKVMLTSRCRKMLTQSYLNKPKFLVKFPKNIFQDISFIGFFWLNHKFCAAIGLFTYSNLFTGKSKDESTKERIVFCVGLILMFFNMSALIHTFLIDSTKDLHSALRVSVFVINSILLLTQVTIQFIILRL